MEYGRGGAALSPALENVETRAPRFYRASPLFIARRQ